MMSKEKGKPTITLVHFPDLPNEHPPVIQIMIAFVPSGQCSDLWSGELSQWMEVQAIDGEAGDVQQPCRRCDIKQVERGIKI